MMFSVDFWIWGFVDFWTFGFFGFGVVRLGGREVGREEGVVGVGARFFGGWGGWGGLGTE